MVPRWYRAGILFYFINANIENQYEFVLQRWVNDSEFAGAVRLNPKSKDPLIGTQDPAESIFVIPQANGGPPIEVKGLSTFATTKAAAVSSEHHSHQIYRQLRRRLMICTR